MASSAHHHRRLLAVAALALLAGSVTVEQAHLALVRHVRCAAHGELTHARDRVAPAPPGEGVQLSAVSMDDEGHAHDHCAASSRAAPSELDRAGPGAPVAGGWAAVGEPVLDACSPRRVWALAPKGSPPRA